MKIGKDISLSVCRREGYMVMEFNMRDLIQKGKLNKDCRVTLSASNPSAWTDNGRPNINAILDGTSLWLLPPTEFSWRDLMGFIDTETTYTIVSSCCDWENCKPDFYNPNEYDFLHLASDIYMTMGLE